jgi:hypothetical protein
MGHQVEADAGRFATQQFASREEALAALRSLTPAGFKPRREYFGQLGDVSALAMRMAAYAPAHEADVNRMMAPMLVRLEPLMKRVLESMERQFPR